MICAEGRSDLGAPAPATILLRPSLGLRRDARSNQPSSRTSPTRMADLIRLRFALLHSGFAHACPPRVSQASATSAFRSATDFRSRLPRTMLADSPSCRSIVLKRWRHTTPRRLHSGSLHKWFLPDPNRLTQRDSIHFNSRRSTSAPAHRWTSPTPPSDRLPPVPLWSLNLVETRPEMLARLAALAVMVYRYEEARRWDFRSRFHWHGPPARRNDSRSRYSLRVWATGLAATPSKDNETLCSKPPYSMPPWKGTRHRTGSRRFPPSPPSIQRPGSLRHNAHCLQRG